MTILSPPSFSATPTFNFLKGWRGETDLNAWYDTKGEENGDKCAWKWGPVKGTLGNGAYNITVAAHNWLIQMNWENARGGGCDQKLGGSFYSQ